MKGRGRCPRRVKWSRHRAQTVMPRPGRCDTAYTTPRISDDSETRAPRPRGRQGARHRGRNKPVWDGTLTLLIIIVLIVLRIRLIIVPMRLPTILDPVLFLLLRQTLLDERLQLVRDSDIALLHVRPSLNESVRRRRDHNATTQQRDSPEQQKAIRWPLNMPRRLLRRMRRVPPILPIRARRSVIRRVRVLRVYGVR